MSPAAHKSDDDYQALLIGLQEALGVVVGDSKRGEMTDRLAPVMQQFGISSILDLAQALHETEEGELRTGVLQAITSHDSLWFAYPEVSTLMNEYILPSAVNQNRGDYRIWLVGCGSGQSAYSLAMTVDAFRLQYGMACGTEIVATDLSLKTVREANEGRYTESMLDGLSDSLRQKYLSRQDGDWEVDEELKNMISFRTCNLQQGFEDMGRFDLIICPDTLIYFSNGVKHGILDGFADLLDSSGILVVGNNEPVLPFSKRFDRVNHEAGTFYRQLPDA